jgi:acyl-ACP thioesterase
MAFERAANVQLAEFATAEPASGRVFEQTLMPGIADSAASGRVRVDAIARWLQDVAYTDLLDAGLEQSGVWIVRRMRIRIEAFPRFGTPVTMRTFCSGIGRFSAERTTTVRGATGAIDAVALWIWIDEHGRPSRFPDRFVGLYGESAAGRNPSTRLRHPEPASDCERSPWTFRAVDVDVAGHVNNSHYWEPLEERFAASEPETLDAEIEHREPALPGEALIVSAQDALWIERADGALHASIRFAGEG